MKAERVNCREWECQPERPGCPKTAAFFGSCFHDAIGKGLLDISETNFDWSLLFRVHKVQKTPLGGLNVDVKSVKKSLAFVVCGLDAKSDIMLYIPDKWSIAGKAAWRCWRRTANALNMQEAHLDELFCIL